ncbi:MAG: hypothetical protein ABI760_19065 [Ferruginibacter sp.]
MCNCGKKREEYPARQSYSLSGSKNIEPQQNKMWGDVHFEYTGLSALTVTGNISGKIYRFTRPGNVQIVDYRDASGMIAVPVLRKVNKK